MVVPSTSTRLEPACQMPGGCDVVAGCLAPDCARPDFVPPKMLEEAQVWTILFSHNPILLAVFGDERVIWDLVAENPKRIFFYGPHDLNDKHTRKEDM